MSVLGPMYDIPSLIRYGIEVLTKWDNKEKIEYGLEDVRNRLNESASELTETQLQEVMKYLVGITEYLNGIINELSNLGIKAYKDEEVKENEEPEEKPSEEQEEFTELQKFARHIFADHINDLNNQVHIINSALQIVNIAREEIGKHLPEVLVCDNADGRVLCKVTGDTYE